MSAQPAIDFLAARHASRESTGNEPAWLTATRKTAMAHVATQGFPTPRNENWKYTNLRTLHRREYEPGAAITGDIGSWQSLETKDLPSISFINGRLHQSTDGLTIKTISSVLENNPDQLAGRLSALVDYQTHPLAALNTAFFEDGVIIEVTADQPIDKPLLLEFISAPTTVPALICPRIMIVMAANTRLEIIERHVGLADSENFTNTVTEVQLGDGARLDHYRLQEASDKDVCAHLLAVHQAANSQLHTHSVDLGGKLVRNDLQTWLCGTGAEAHLAGFYMALGTQHVDNHTRIDHNAPHTSSYEDYRGVLADRARAVFNGKVVVAKDAQKVDANQSNKNLILSGRAEIDTKPELEIYADDVKCSHGATVGQLDDDALFYLRSRGLDEQTARALLTFAFVDELLNNFEIDALREYVDKTVALRLPGHEKLQVLE